MQRAAGYTAGTHEPLTEWCTNSLVICGVSRRLALSVQFARKDGLRWCRCFQMPNCEDARWSWSELETRTYGLDRNPMKSLICSCQLLFISFVFLLGSGLNRLILNEYIIYLPIHKERASPEPSQCAFRLHVRLAARSTPFLSLPLSIILPLRFTLDSLKLIIFIKATLIH